jgi:hypothetical protein
MVKLIMILEQNRIVVAFLEYTEIPPQLHDNKQIVTSVMMIVWVLNIKFISIVFQRYF